MAIYELTSEAIRPLDATTFRDAEIRERQDLQRVLRDRIDVVSPDTMVIAEEFGDWDESRRRIDLLGLDSEANLVVVELKRTEDGGHMELQAMRYAAMVSAMTFAQAVDIHAKFLKAIGREYDAEQAILEFLGWDEPDEESFAQDVRVVLASAAFSKELTTSVMWLNERDIDIRCVRLRPYADGERVLLDVQQVVPLPEAEQYQVKVREKSQRERKARKFSPDLTKYDVMIKGTTWSALPKRRVVFHVIKHLTERGVSPRSIIENVTFRRPNSFFEVPGEYGNEDEFIEAATKVAEQNGRTFKDGRFFTADDELIVSDGYTFALSNQWGRRAIEWVNQVLAAFPKDGVSVKEHVEGQDIVQVDHGKVEH